MRKKHRGSKKKNIPLFCLIPENLWCPFHWAFVIAYVYLFIASIVTYNHARDRMIWMLGMLGIWLRCAHVKVKIVIQSAFLRFSLSYVSPRFCARCACPRRFSPCSCAGYPCTNPCSCAGPSHTPFCIPVLIPVIYQSVLLCWSSS